MGMLKFEVGHSLDREEARQRVAQLLDYWSAKYGVKSTWSGDQAHVSGKAMGLSFHADLEVTATKVGGEATDPGFLLRERARKYLAEKFASYLGPAAPEGEG